MDFPLIDYLDEDACYRKLVALLHPDGLGLPPVRSTRTAWGSTAAAGSRSWSTSAATAAGCSTPGPGPSSRGRTAAPPNCC